MMRKFFQGISERFTAAHAHRHDLPERFTQEVVMIDGMTKAPEPCTLLGIYSPEKLRGPYIAQLKVNGIRAIATPQRIVTRHALPFEAALHIRPVLDEIERAYGCPLVIDGEYLELGGFNETLSAYRKRKGSGVMHIFDAVPYREWKANKFTVPLDERLAMIAAAVEKVNSPFTHMLHWEPMTAEMIMPTAESLWADGFEGLVVKKARSLYQRCRTDDWLKVKKRDTMDGIIMDVLPHPAGTTAKSIMVKVASGKTYRIGSGLSDSLRRDLIATPDKYIGSLIEFGATDTNDNNAFTGLYFIRLRDGT